MGISLGGSSYPYFPSNMPTKDKKEKVKPTVVCQAPRWSYSMLICTSGPLVAAGLATCPNPRIFREKLPSIQTFAHR
jgi:hypothetical protein